jgi:alkylation response protein AidB-like acyl-CoA dehydrogenase
MFLEAIDDILRDLCTPAVVRAVEADGDSAQGAALWQALTQAGFMELLAPESAGGAGMSLAELYAIVACLGRHACPLPVAQTLAARLLMDGAADAGRISFAPAAILDAEGRCVCEQVPMGRVADTVLVPVPPAFGAAASDTGNASDAGARGPALAQDVWVLPVIASAGSAERVPSGEPAAQAARLVWPAAALAQARRLPGRAAALESLAAALHAALLAGAMARVVDMTLAYCNERQQFGRPLGKFQAVQHQLAVMAEQLVAASVAAESGFQPPAHVEASASTAAPHPLQAAIAKARASEAALAVAQAAHALHGAIGVTAEYDLQLWTRRLHAWRHAHGSEAHWHARVGQAVLAQPLSPSQFVRDALA